MNDYYFPTNLVNSFTQISIVTRVIDKNVIDLRSRHLWLRSLLQKIEGFFAPSLEKVDGVDFAKTVDLKWDPALSIL